MLRHVAQRSIPSGLERSTQAWAAAAVLVAIYAGWQAVPQILWYVIGPLRWALSGLFYLAWTLILIGAFLASHLDLFEVVESTGAAPSVAADDRGQAQGASGVPFRDMLRQPLYIGILIAVWATPVMTIGHLLLAAGVTGYLLFDGLWAVHKTSSCRDSSGAFSLQGKRLTR